MTLQILKQYGKSPVVFLPTSIMQAANLHLEQQIRLSAERGRIIIEAVAEEMTLDTLLAEITPKNLHHEIDFGKPEGKELI